MAGNYQPRRPWPLLCDQGAYPDWSADDEWLDDEWFDDDDPFADEEWFDDEAVPDGPEAGTIRTNVLPQYSHRCLLRRRIVSQL
ncbi:hypothetical protein ACRE_039520 [Hapsidospora chrysogenum ATCC 11550]|uniref:Uncharacterized protein n=1 Tax=Hapsidospora chrysogenum (strain ATCC 11550 / CBS 779.69 / DSM 880 / IAM 14645 / JCM 23072 / IMI 49137) TaxID=857340 RepID=A0A086T783_HAPC1|nr:hypothetical protein ACRE_039520 [Hapsidospora chrysogenum ATCC 11550]